MKNEFEITKWDETGPIVKTFITTNEMIDKLIVSNNEKENPVSLTIKKIDKFGWTTTYYELKSKNDFYK